MRDRDVLTPMRDRDVLTVAVKWESDCKLVMEVSRELQLNLYE
jgi:hypothetical protein